MVCACTNYAVNNSNQIDINKGIYYIGTNYVYLWKRLLKYYKRKKKLLLKNKIEQFEYECSKIWIHLCYIHYKGEIWSNKYIPPLLFDIKQKLHLRQNLLTKSKVNYEKLQQIIDRNLLKAYLDSHKICLMTDIRKIYTYSKQWIL